MRLPFQFGTPLLSPPRNTLCVVVTALVLNLFGAVSLAGTKASSTATPFVGEVDAWAMLSQMMSRLESAIAKQELTLIDTEDPFASAAVSSLLAEVKKRPGPQNVALKMKWIGFVRLISTLHEAADKNDLDKAKICLLYTSDAADEL